MSQRATKACVLCGETFARHPKHSRAQWDAVMYCGASCRAAGSVKHGERHTRLYLVWAGIKTRCHNENDPLFRWYGARGIGMCPEWRESYAAFAAHVGPDPGPVYQVGRIDNQRGYEPGNVRWETSKENNRNKRSTLWVSMNGKRVCFAEACEYLGLEYKREWAKLKKGASCLVEWVE